MNEKETLEEFYNKLVQLVNQTKSYGDDIPDKRLNEKILISLPFKFEPKIAVIEETKDISTISVEELIGLLKSYEQRLNRYSEKSVESAFQSMLNLDSRSTDKRPQESSRGGRSGRGRGRNSRGRGRGSYDRKIESDTSQKKCRICNRSSHEEKDCWFKGKPQCHNCKKFGHLKKDCRFNSNQQANYTEEKEDEGIFLDMDTSYHSQVRLGNGALVEVKGKGTIGVQSKRGAEHIHDVLFVPDLDQSLLSVGQLVEHGYSIHFEDGECIIFDNKQKKQVL
ncbi:uncharacterized protein LOC120112232 [Phoenix dactylifera]|uniref:Uncharacterized protein LOC120112232 n=1 Tax=Phoenix dactylifera TaxID=42345 RepID=A0A8B9AUI8_PHODC|nr:uncharacterized protein LOC120112232 [Phoenix dactylifera]